MTVKVTLQCRTCNAVSIDEFDNEIVATFNTSNVSDCCTVCENNSKVISKVEDVDINDFKNNNKSLIEVPDNAFTNLLIIGAVTLFWIFVMYALGNQNW
jgi:hypothetical protein